jgi:hypothetical protein
VLFSAVVSHRSASCCDAGGQRRLADESVAPHAVEELLLRHHTVVVFDEVAQQVEHLRLDVTALPVAPQLETPDVELELGKLEDHRPMMARRST